MLHGDFLLNELALVVAHGIGEVFGWAKASRLSEVKN